MGVDKAAYRSNGNPHFMEFFSQEEHPPLNLLAFQNQIITLSFHQIERGHHGIFVFLLEMLVVWLIVVLMLATLEML